MVWARRLRRRALEPRELAVVLAQHGERVRLPDPRVVGDLVVADEGGVADGHALHDVAREHRDVQVAHHDGDRRSASAYSQLRSTCCAPLRRWRRAAQRSRATSASDSHNVRSSP